MAVRVKKITLWRKEVENRPGLLAETLEPLAEAGADLRVVMGYRYPGRETRAAIELHPVTRKKVVAAAESAGLSGYAMPTLLVEGDNRPGMGHAICRTLADAGMNLTFLVAQVIGERYSAVIGFEKEDDAEKATTLIKKAART